MSICKEIRNFRWWFCTPQSQIDS